jgi:hypothetical protein
MASCALPSRRFTAPALNQWRVSRGLYVRELAKMLGYSCSRLKDKLYERSPLTEQLDAQLENVELLLAAGIRPYGWPARLDRRIVVTRIDYTESVNPQKL